MINVNFLVSLALQTHDADNYRQWMYVLRCTSCVLRPSVLRLTYQRLGICNRVILEKLMQLVKLP